MKKMILVVLSLLVVGMFLVGCSTGEAVRGKPQMVKPVTVVTESNCKLVYVEDSDFGKSWNGNKFCAERGGTMKTCLGINKYIHQRYYTQNNCAFDSAVFIDNNFELIDCNSMLGRGHKLNDLNPTKGNCLWAEGVPSKWPTYTKFTETGAVICCN